MSFRHSSIAATIAGMALLTGIAAGPAQAQQENAPYQGPNSAPNTQNLDSNEAPDTNNTTETQNLDSNEAPVSDINDRNTEGAQELVERRIIRGNDFFTRGDRTSVLVPRGPHGAYFPVEYPGFGGPDFLGR